MWTISSNDIEQAKQRIDHRRGEMEARYAAEKNALEAEVAAIEALERTAVEFAQRHSLADPLTAATLLGATIETPSQEPAIEGTPAGYTEPVGFSGVTEMGADPESPPSIAVESEPAGGAESNLGYDILKPGSRWRLNRAARLLHPEDETASPPSP